MKSQAKTQPSVPAPGAAAPRIDKVNWIGLKTFIHRELQRPFRVPIQTLMTPWIMALLYIFVFGRVIGSRIEAVGGVSYIDFVLPGILMLNVLMAAFSHTSSSLYFQRFARHIEEILVAPLSHFEMITGYVLAGVVRASIVGAGVFFIAYFFSAANLEHLFLALFYILAGSTLFSLIGLLVGLWAKQFEQLAVLGIFVITPLSYVGGMFNTLDMLPVRLQRITTFNPFWYFIDGMRYALIGVHESNLWAGALLIVFLLVAVGMLVWRLFSIGWRLRD